VGTEPEDLGKAMEYMEKYAFLPRDAMHLAVMYRQGVSSMVSTDDDFVPVDELRLFTCNPRILARRL
jgi:predicted nucleic acid-binding protein